MTPCLAHWCLDTLREVFETAFAGEAWNTNLVVLGSAWLSVLHGWACLLSMAECTPLGHRCFVQPHVSEINYRSFLQLIVEPVFNNASPRIIAVAPVDFC